MTFWVSATLFVLCGVALAWLMGDLLLGKPDRRPRRSGWTGMVALAAVTLASGLALFRQSGP